MAEAAVSTETSIEPQKATGLIAALEGFGGLNAIRQIMVMVGLAASIAFGFGIVLWSKEPTYQPLYTDISHLEAGQVADLLNRQNIKFKVDTNNGMVLVEQSRIHDARLLLAKEGFPAGNAMGYELLDKEQAFGTSQFMEKARYYRSIEGEMARTISSMNKVRSARVHVAVPKRSVFVNDRRKPSASVFVELYPGQTLDRMQVAAIVNLVASSIPELPEKQVTVVDQRGNLLSEKDENQDLVLAARQFEYTRKLEETYIDRINEILLPIVGNDRFRVQVSADVDFSVTEQTAEIFNPDLPAVRSEQTLSEVSTNGGVAGVPGALSNQPPGAVSVPEKAGEAAGSESATGNQRKQATRNYELDRTISHTKQQVGTVRRLSVAVVVDDKLIPPAEGSDQPTKQPLTDAEIERITVLVKDAVGFSAARGDRVTVINEAFQELTPVGPELPPEEFWKEPWFQDYVKLGIGALGVIVIGLVLQSILRRLVDTGKNEIVGLEGVEGGELGLEGLGADGLGEGADVTLSGGTNPLLPGPESSYEQQVDAVKSMVAEDPKRVAQVIKTWLADE